MSTPENDPLNPEKPPTDPAPPQYGQRAPQDPNAAGQPPYGQPPQYGAQQPNPYGQNPNPYGQPAPANNPYGQQPPQGPYGQQPYAGGFPVPPQGNFAPPQMPTHRPKELDTSFWAILAAGVAFLLSSVFGLSTAAIMEQVEAVPELEEQLAAAGMSISDAIPMIQTTAIVFAVVGLLIYVLIAFMVRKGSGVARIFATIFAVLSLFSIGSGLLMALSVVLGVVGVVFAWLRPSSQFIAARRAARAAGYR
ncbi:hypothetical protein ACIPVK_11415 [Paeniglutamicibacter sp. MACA_103]|uniref:hypothetical protein n=1 Tax=Paeniglutamicibacter sp. MACA_103 TaxID=3377337 RepID=UPI003895DF6E